MPDNDEQWLKDLCQQDNHVIKNDGFSDQVTNALPRKKYLNVVILIIMTLLGALLMVLFQPGMTINLTILANPASIISDIVLLIIIAIVWILFDDIVLQYF